MVLTWPLYVGFDEAGGEGGEWRVWPKGDGWGQVWGGTLERASVHSDATRRAYG